MKARAHIPSNNVLAFEMLHDELERDHSNLKANKEAESLRFGVVAISSYLLSCSRKAENCRPIAPGASENAAIALSRRGVRSSVVRLSPSVHGEGEHGFVPALINIARTKGVSGYIGDGSNRWPAVHRLDAAHLFHLALEKAPAGSVLHGAADEGVPTRAIAEVIGRHLDLPVVAISPEDAGEHFGWLGASFSLDNPTSSVLTCKLLGWHPVQPGLLADLDQDHYFKNER